MGFRKSLSEATLYIKGDEINFVIVSMYVDDLLVIGNNSELIDKFKKDMQHAFEMTDLGEMTYFLGMEVKQKKWEVFICQTKYAKKILMKFIMD